MAKNDRGSASYVMIAVLTVLLGIGIWLLPGREPTFGDVAHEREHLTERWERYMDMRRNDEWVAIYDELIDPAHRAIVNRSKFMECYGKGKVKVHDVELKTIEVDPSTQSAQLVAKIELEIVPANLDEPHRSTFVMPDDPALLRSAADVPRDWVWRQGEWYLRIEANVLNHVMSSSGAPRKPEPIKNK